MKTWLCILSTLVLSSVFADPISANQGVAVSHDDIPQFSMHGNFQKGVATKSMGAKQFEVWRSSIAVGSRTPLHVHETEEVFVILKGHILAIVGGQEVHCIAPATLICPSNVPHQLINAGDEPTDQILVVGIDSKISTADGEVMTLPWRK